MVPLLFIGKLEQARPLIEMIKQRTNRPVLLTFFSPSGYTVRKDYVFADQVEYLPLDTPLNARHFINLFQPRLLVLVKYDFWYNHMLACYQKRIPVILISALFRPKQYFFRWYGRPFLRPYYRRSWLQMVPLRIGGGTRLKIVESLAIGTPVVSTTIGAQGLDLKHEANILLADTSEAFADQIIRALQNSPLREHLRVNGIRTAKERFGWRRIGAGLCKAIEARFKPAERQQIRIMNVRLDVVTMPQTIERITEMIESRQPHYLATANVDFLVQSTHDTELRRILDKAHLVVCDGTPLVWLSRWLGKPLPERVAGSDLVPELLTTAEKKRWRVFFLGGERGVLAQAVRNVEMQYPDLEFAGAFSPPFAPLDKMNHDAINRRIREANPDLLLVSFGCPKQEKWIARNYQTLGVPVSVGVGATIDFLAGSMRRAPMWMRKCGLEWVFRLLQEPKRLLRRYAADLAVFGCGSMKELTGALVYHKSSRS